MALHPGAVVFVQRFTKAVTVFPHIHVLVLDGAHEEMSEDELVFHDDHGPPSEKQHGLPEDTERRFVCWLKRHDFLATAVIELASVEPTFHDRLQRITVTSATRSDD